MVRAAVFSVALLAASTTSAVAPPVVAFVWPQRIVSSGDDLRWIVRVERRAEHRSLTVAAFDDAGLVRSSSVQLDGADAPRTHWVDWKTGLPGGEYTVMAVVFGQTGELARASVTLIVVSRL